MVPVESSWGVCSAVLWVGIGGNVGRLDWALVARERRGRLTRAALSVVARLVRAFISARRPLYPFSCG